nr:MAG TPA: hypothetical protein [Caudoviricetes sp.]
MYVNHSGVFQPLFLLAGQSVEKHKKIAVRKHRQPTAP